MRRFVGIVTAVALGAAPAAAAPGPPPKAGDPFPVCQPGDDDYDEASYNARRDCLYQPADGSATLSPSRLKLGQTTTVTWTPGSFGELSTVGGWYHIDGFGASGRPFTAMALGHPDPDDGANTPVVTLRAVDGRACYHSSNCAMRLERQQGSPAWPGYYRVLLGFGAEEDPPDDKGTWVAQLQVVENVKPKADFTVRRVAGLTFEFDGTVSTDDEAVTSYEWIIDGELVETAKATHTFDKPGTYGVSLHVRDAEGENDLVDREVQITAEEPPPPDTSGGGGGGPAPTPASPAAPLVPAPPVVIAPPAPAPSPLAGLSGLRAAAKATRAGALGVGTAANPPTASTTQRLVIRRKGRTTTLAKGRTAIPAGGRRPLKLRLTKAGRKAVRRGRTAKATLVVTARGGDGRAETTRKSLKLSGSARGPAS